MSKEEIKWKYFFGGGGGRIFDRYYYCEINGVRCEKHATNKGVEFSIGNIDKAKVKFKTKEELLTAIKQNQ
jgi:hypothetical protein